MNPWRPFTDAERAIAEHFTADLRRLPPFARPFAKDLLVQLDRRGGTVTDDQARYMCRIIARNVPGKFPAVLQVARDRLYELSDQLELAP